MELAQLRQSYDANTRLYEQQLADPEHAPPFWDVLVITASDEHQSEHYRSACATRCQAGTLPPRLKIHTFADPEGPCIGSGGATLLALHRLSGLYSSEDLGRLRIMVLLAGGSQQIHSKVLSRVPVGLGSTGEVMGMLEAKLVTSASVATQVPPGTVLVTCVDHLAFFSTCLLYTSPSPRDS
eukprot:TRINITY_DN5140_c0_g1_i3.p1 TRINITY_DN5140_c0_g1~~TRINITY_DN5140_c0_g1_i3.p1  ORF type:complete len:182 (-),score=53.17 TRINITY_DN5140_c0_g1_i3:127-672(-)